MSLKAVLFDLDGTLLPMDMDKFIKTYFGGLAKRMAPFGYRPDELVNAIWAGTAAMVKNRGEKTNEAVFWDKFAEIFGEGARGHEPEFARFYEEDFDSIRAVCGFDESARSVIDRLRETPLKLALATSPIFPAAATERRIRWAGLEPELFDCVTTYENSRRAKPNPDYYRDVAAALGVKPEECLMVGNDVSEDMAASEVGMRVFLVPKCLINKENKDISAYPSGDLLTLLGYILNIMKEDDKANGK